MRVKREDLIRKVALMMGETPNTSVDSQECECGTLAERIALEIELQAAKVVAATPRGELTGWQLLDDEGLTSMEDGSALLPLPADFMMLHTLRLAGWERGVTEVSLSGSREALLQSGRHDGLRGTRERPVAVLTPYGTGMALRLYGAHIEPPEIVEGWYMPMPHTDSTGYLELPEAAVGRLIEAVAEGVVRRGC